MPPPLLERLALELFRIVLLLVFVVFGFWAIPADDVELQTQQRTDRRFDRADLDWAQQHGHQHIDELKLVHLSWWLRCDGPRDVWRAFGQLSARHAEHRVSVAS
jgi:hypothetical protein